MPVLTRSMMKHSGSLNYDAGSISSSSTSSNTILDSELITTPSLLASSQTSPSLPVISSPPLCTEDHFEISNFETLENSNSGSFLPSLFPSLSVQNFTMESECNDQDKNMKIDPDPPDSQAMFQQDILKMLTAISSQMMANYQDLQDQLVCHDLKLSTELQRVTQENENFKN